MRIDMNDPEKQVLEILHNLNWLLESHNSSVELVEIKDERVIVHCVGYCAECETDCVGVAFKERMPDIKLIFQ
jgi:Fe-S cluster biogenesis protein NfuA